MNLARLGTRVCVIAGGAMLAALAACDGPNGATDASASDDAGIDGGPVHSDGGVLPMESPTQCFDEEDNDLDELADCADSDCAGAACCVGSGAETCCVEGTPIPIVEIDECADGSELDCLGSDVAIFGSATPTIENGALVPQGGPGNGHAGVSLATPIDPRGQNLTLTANIDVPAARCANCADGAGIGLFGELPDASSAVLLGVVASGSLGQLLVIVADEIVARAQLVTGVRDISITVNVEGTVTVYDDGVQVGDTIVGVALPDRVWPAVFGRTDNRGDGIRAVGVYEAQLSAARCEVPSAIVRRGAPVLPWSGTPAFEPVAVRAPSVVAYTDGQPQMFMVYAYEGNLHGAERTPAGEFHGGDGDPGPALVALPEGVVSVSDPSVVVDDDRFHLYFAGTDIEGVSNIYKAEGDPDFATTFAAPVIVATAELLGVDSIDGPAVEVGNPTWHMLARARIGGSTRIIELRAPYPGVLFSLARGDLDSSTLRVPEADDLFAFDRDEVAAPARVVHEDVMGRPLERLYYAGRRGTRWSIGALVSDGFGGWRPIGPVLEPQGAGFDALGVTDPALFVERGVVRFYYAGTDGQRYAIGEAGPAGTGDE
jgi:hypothetical protein